MSLDPYDMMKNLDQCFMIVFYVIECFHGYVDASYQNAGKLAYDGPLYARLKYMMDSSLVPVPCISSMFHMCMTDLAYDGPIFLVPLSLSYASSPAIKIENKLSIYWMNKKSYQWHPYYTFFFLIWFLLIDFVCFSGEEVHYVPH